MAILSLQHVTHIFGTGSAQTQVLRDVSFEAESGTLTLIVGPSGSGKSTLLTIAGGLLTPTSGKVQLADHIYAQCSRQQLDQLRLQTIGFVLQNYRLLPYLTVADQFKFVDRVNHRQNIGADALDTLLNQLGIEKLLNKFPEQLSGGQQQRVTIARSLYPDPAVILADEPTAALDSARVNVVGKILQQLAHERQKAVVVVTHDDRLRRFADQVFEMRDGQLKQVGAAQSIDRQAI